MTRAISPGQFAPVTNGHGDLISRAARLFDQVIVAVAIDTGKATCLDLDQRVALVEKVVEKHDNVIVKAFTGLLVGFCEQQQAGVVIRGLRAVSDFEYEFQLASMNRRLAPQIETLFLTPAEQYSFISSSLVREIARLGGDVAEFVHPDVRRALSANFS